MRIRLLCDIPVEPEHGLRKGRVMEMLLPSEGGSRIGAYVLSDVGEKIYIAYEEWEFVDGRYISVY